MKTYLFTTYHEDKVAARNEELLKCLEINLKKFDHVYLFGEQPFKAIGWNNAEWIAKEGRPTFTDFFECIKTINDPNGLFIMANADIFFTQLFLHQLKDIYKKSDDFFCSLSRWDIFKFEDEHRFEAIPFLRNDSSDCWTIKGMPRITKADYKIGIPGVDNKIPLEANNAGYRVVNPSRDMKIYHLHTSQVRNYALPNGEVTERYLPPYMRVEPCYLNDILK